jgi:hypothetical protein
MRHCRLRMLVDARAGKVRGFECHDAERRDRGVKMGRPSKLTGYQRNEATKWRDHG